jgi:Tfp pilus assembly protein PilN
LCHRHQTVHQGQQVLVRVLLKREGMGDMLRGS